MTLVQNDIVVLYTDGLIECEKDKYEEYGKRRLKRIIKALCNNSAKEICDAIVHDAHKFSGEKIKADDVTLIVCKVLK